jgi:hypothetical protein
MDSRWYIPDLHVVSHHWHFSICPTVGLRLVSHCKRNCCQVPVAFGCQLAYIHIFIHRSIIRTSWIECGIYHEKSWIAICSQIKSLSYKLHKIGKNMVNYKERSYAHNSSKQWYALHNITTSKIRMFICLHHYDQQIEIPQWNKRHF